jgi:hypothetical protein
VAGQDLGRVTVGVTTPHTQAPPSEAERRAPITVGPVTLERAARVLEQALATVWGAVLESHGHDPATGWEVVVEGLSLRPVAPAAAPVNGRPPLPAAERAGSP